ncbi:hypothetical protein FB451DRAFT_1415067 [Mycena latifolia]|nr:hypothetical protein FB451DRAFT_1415067 [Mycena latifolia]
MTHTPKGNSGIGDFGREGIHSFIRDHSCGALCRSLGLDKTIILTNEPEHQMVDPESDEEDEDAVASLVDSLGQPV